MQAQAVDRTQWSVGQPLDQDSGSALRRGEIAHVLVGVVRLGLVPSKSIASIRIEQHG